MISSDHLLSPQAKSSAEAINPRESRVAAALAAKAERRRMEVEKKRKEKEEEKEEERQRQENKDLTEEIMRLELEEERGQRAQQARFTSHAIISSHRRHNRSQQQYYVHVPLFNGTICRLRKLKEEEAKQRRAERESEGQTSEQAETEKERRRQEETRNKKRYLERLQKERHEEEMRRAGTLSNAYCCL